jgi:Neuraminidase (sialidase)
MSTVAVFSQQSNTIVTEYDSELTDLVEVADQVIQASMSTTDQKYPSKEVTFKINVKSAIDSGRIAIQWYYPRSLFTIIGSDLDNITLLANQEYNASKSFIPIILINEKNTGIRPFSIGLKVTAFSNEKNYFTIIKGSYLFDADYQLTPLTDKYRFEKTEYEVNKILINLVIASVVFTIVGFVLGKFVSYINSPDKLILK